MDMEIKLKEILEENSSKLAEAKKELMLKDKTLKLPGKKQLLIMVTSRYLPSALRTLKGEIAGTLSIGFMGTSSSSMPYNYDDLPRFKEMDKLFQQSLHDQDKYFDLRDRINRMVTQDFNRIVASIVLKK